MDAPQTGQDEGELIEKCQAQEKKKNVVVSSVTTCHIHL